MTFINSASSIGASLPCLLKAQDVEPVPAAAPSNDGALSLRNSHIYIQRGLLFRRLYSMRFKHVPLHKQT